MFRRNCLVLLKSRAFCPINTASKPAKSLELSHRWASTLESGALLAKPQTDGIGGGLVKLALAVIPGCYIGATISKNCAKFLEENDIFVASDDDDDD